MIICREYRTSASTVHPKYTGCTTVVLVLFFSLNCAAVSRAYRRLCSHAPDDSIPYFKLIGGEAEWLEYVSEQAGWSPVIDRLDPQCRTKCHRVLNVKLII